MIRNQSVSASAISVRCVAAWTFVKGLLVSSGFRSARSGGNREFEGQNRKLEHDRDPKSMILLQHAKQGRHAPGNIRAVAWRQAAIHDFEG